MYALKVLYPCSPRTERGMSTKLSSSKDVIMYPNRRTVIVHHLKDPALSKSFSGHAQNVTVARFSPTGNYCASADVTGLVKIWDTIGEDQSVKWQYNMPSKQINDLAWDGESQRIIAVGGGTRKFAHAFAVDTGTGCGQITGHIKNINSVSIRQQRPYRAVTGDDSGLIVFHQGLPWKDCQMIRTHKNFVNDVEYAPSSRIFASVGSDCKVFLYDGNTGDTVAELTDHPHQGSIMACSWSADSMSFMTSSLDCTVKLWNVECQKVVRTWTVGEGLKNHQVGCVWTTSDDLISLSLSGNLNVFDQREGDRPTRVLQAPQLPITAAVHCPSGTLIAGSADGRVFSYDPSLHSVHNVEGENHTSQVCGLVAGPRGKLYSSGFDNRIREIDSSGASHRFTQATFELPSQPKDLAVTEDGSIFVLGANVIEAIRDSHRIFELIPSYIPSAIGGAANLVAVGAENCKVYVYTWNGQKLTESFVMEANRGLITAVTVSANGEHIAAGDSGGKIVLFSAVKKEMITNRWTHHVARIHCLSFLSSLPSEPATHLASTSLDTNVYIFSIANVKSHVEIKGAAPGGGATVTWFEHYEGKAKLASAGADGCVRIWDVILPQ